MQCRLRSGQPRYETHTYDQIKAAVLERQAFSISPFDRQAPHTLPGSQLPGTLDHIRHRVDGYGGEAQTSQLYRQETGAAANLKYAGIAGKSKRLDPGDDGLQALA